MVNMQTQSNTFATHEKGSIPTKSFHQSASNFENMVYRPQFQSWQSRECPSKTASFYISSLGFDKEREREEVRVREETGKKEKRLVFNMTPHGQFI